MFPPLDTDYQIRQLRDRERKELERQIKQMRKTSFDTEDGVGLVAAYTVHRERVLNNLEEARGLAQRIDAERPALERLALEAEAAERVLTEAARDRDGSHIAAEQTRQNTLMEQNGATLQTMQRTQLEAEIQRTQTQRRHAAVMASVAKRLVLHAISEDTITALEAKRSFAYRGLRAQRDAAQAQKMAQDVDQTPRYRQVLEDEVTSRLADQPDAIPAHVKARQRPVRPA